MGTYVNCVLSIRSLRFNYSGRGGNGSGARACQPGEHLRNRYVTRNVCHHSIRLQIAAKPMGISGLQSSLLEARLSGKKAREDPPIERAERFPSALLQRLFHVSTATVFLVLGSDGDRQLAIDFLFRNEHQVPCCRQSWRPRSTR